MDCNIIVSCGHCMINNQTERHTMRDGITCILEEATAMVNGCWAGMSFSLNGSIWVHGQHPMQMASEK